MNNAAKLCQLPEKNAKSVLKFRGNSLSESSVSHGAGIWLEGSSPVPGWKQNSLFGEFFSLLFSDAKIDFTSSLTALDVNRRREKKNSPHEQCEKPRDKLLSCNQKQKARRLRNQVQVCLQSRCLEFLAFGFNEFFSSRLVDETVFVSEEWKNKSARTAKI